MKLKLIFMVMLAAIISPAATVTFTLTNSLGIADTNVFRVWPVGDPIAADGRVITKGVPILLRPNSSGIVSTNLQKGNYLASNQWLVANFGIPGSLGSRQGIVFAVPDSTNSYGFEKLPISGYNTYNYSGSRDGTLLADHSINSNKFDLATLALFGAGGGSTQTNVSYTAVTNAPWARTNEPNAVSLTNAANIFNGTFSGTVISGSHPLSSTFGKVVGFSTNGTLIEGVGGWSNNVTWFYYPLAADGRGLTNGSPTNFFGAGTIPVSNLARGTPDGTRFVSDSGDLLVPAGTGDPRFTSSADTITAGSNVFKAHMLVSRTNYVDRVEATNQGSLTLVGGNAELDLTSSSASLTASGGLNVNGVGVPTYTGLNAYSNTLYAQLQRTNEGRPVIQTNANNRLGGNGALITGLNLNGTFGTNMTLDAATLYESLVIGGIFYDADTLGSARMNANGKWVVTDGLTGNATVSAGGQHLTLTAESGSGQTVDVIGAFSASAGIAGDLLASTNYAASNLVSGGQIPVGTLFDYTTNESGWLLVSSGSPATRHRTFNGGSLTGIVASAFTFTPTTNAATLTSGRVQVGNGARGVADATASGAVPIDADGTATTLAQLQALGVISASGLNTNQFTLYVNGNTFVFTNNFIRITNATAANQYTDIGANGGVTNVGGGGTSIMLTNPALAGTYTYLSQPTNGANGTVIEVFTNSVSKFKVTSAGAVTAAGAASFSGQLTSVSDLIIGGSQGVVIYGPSQSGSSYGYTFSTPTHRTLNIGSTAVNGRGITNMTWGIGTTNISLRVDDAATPTLTLQAASGSGGANLNASGTITGNLSGGTNLPIVTSDTIPMGAWWTNNVPNGADITGATPVSVTNTADAFQFADGVTNAIRTRAALSHDWNGGTVEISLRTCSTSTNGLLATNSVFAVRAVAIGDGDALDNLTWGTAIWVTNKISTSAYVSYGTTSALLAVGNTPTSAKSVLWEVQRLGAATGDTTTNAVCLTEVRVFYQRNTRTDFPTPTP